MKTKSILWIYALIMTLPNLYPGLKIDLMQENLTGLAWKNHELLPVFLWSFFTGWGLYVLSRLYWQRNQLIYPGRAALFTAAAMAFCPLIPYTFGKYGWLDDLHVWAAMTGTISFIVQWAYVILVNSPRPLPAAWLIVAFGLISFAMAGFGQTVSGLSEIFFSESLILILTGALSIKKRG